MQISPKNQRREPAELKMTSCGQQDDRPHNQLLLDAERAIMQNGLGEPSTFAGKFLDNEKRTWLWHGH